MQTILIVDDSPTNIRLIGDILSPFYRVRAANSGEKALKNACKQPLPNLILLDVIMPDLDGYAVLKQLRQNPLTREIPVIFVTSMDETADEEYGLDLGAVDYITKPVRPAILQARVRTQMELKSARDKLLHQNEDLEKEVDRRVQENNQIRDITMKALSNLAKTRDNETGNHILRTQGYVETMARYLAKKSHFACELTDKKIDLIVKASPLHDIGKVGTPDAILLKPGKLSEEEFGVMKQHAKLGADALRACMSDIDDIADLDFLKVAIDIANYHHEKWDGSGYPEGLSGDDIPISARLMAIADVFDALISRRVYKAAFPLEKSIEIIREGRGRHFDPEIVDAFEACIADFIAIAERYQEDHP